MSKMTMPAKREADKPEVEAGKKAAVADLKYRFNVYVDKRKMHKYQALCKERGTNANKEIRGYIERQLKNYDDMVDE